MIDYDYIYHYQDNETWLDFNSMMNQIIHAGDPFYISFDISLCNPKASESFTFTLKSEQPAIKINHAVIIENGKCKEICYRFCDTCTLGIVPVISTQSNFTMSVTSNSEGIKFRQASVTVYIAPSVEFNCMMDQMIMPGDHLFIYLNTSGCDFNTIQFNSSSLNMTLKSDDAAIGINHIIIIEN
eukprot:106791_1